MSGYHYYMHVPRDAQQVKEANGSYIDEMANCETFEMTQEEYEYLNHYNGMFKKFDEQFTLFIMECEEDTIEAKDIDKALEIALEYAKKAVTPMEISAVNKVIEALRFAQEKGTFLEFDIRPY